MSKPESNEISKPALTPSEQLQQQEGSLLVLMEDTQRRYPEQPLTREQADAWLDDWRELLSRMGPKIFEKSLRECWLKCKFFPKPADIWEQGSMEAIMRGYDSPEPEKTPEQPKRIIQESTYVSDGLGLADLMSDPRVKEILAKWNQKGTSQ